MVTLPGNFKYVCLVSRNILRFTYEMLHALKSKRRLRWATQIQTLCTSPYDTHGVQANTERSDCPRSERRTWKFVHCLQSNHLEEIKNRRRKRRRRRRGGRDGGGREGTRKEVEGEEEEEEEEKKAIKLT